MKALLGRKKIFYSVKNGKHRDLLEVKPTQFTTVRKLFVKNGIIIKVKAAKIFLQPFFN
jgi:hypothetical protein